MFEGDVLPAEHRAINARRDHANRPLICPSIGADDRPETPTTPVYDTSGICLSGGGIRSAAFCLGALQSLAVNRIFDKLDYMSTVSGGGYIGASISAAMSIPHDFPFAARGKIEDTPAIRHLRDFSNYLLPRGHKTVLSVTAVILRGLAANLVMVTGWGLFVAGLTVEIFPTRSMLDGGFFGLLAVAHSAVVRWSWTSPLTFGPLIFRLLIFGLPLLISGLMLLLLIIWALWPRTFNVSGPLPASARILLILLIAVFVIALQPVLVAAFYSVALASEHSVHGLSLKTLAAALPGIGGAVALLRPQIAALLKSASGRRGRTSLLTTLAGQSAIWAASAIVPIAAYTVFCLWPAAAIVCDNYMRIPYAPCRYPLSFGCLPTESVSHTGAIAYLAVGIVLVFLTFAFKPNANSLHGLYCDKLSKAFLFDPTIRTKANDPTSDLQPRCIQLTAISPKDGGPYHLINAAINLLASKHANRRGRNADFFLLSSQFVGSNATGYVGTDLVQDVDHHIDLGSAMAISGAAISADMGSQSVRTLAPTLALLNLRLGYWLRNPKYMSRTPATFRAAARETKHNFLASLGHRQGPRPRHEFDSFRRRFFGRYLKFYPIREMLGWLDETAPRVYLTDGGHIENLGLYQLLKRRCRVIMVIDAEQDPNMTFDALATAERYARIDLGVRIDLHWEEIAAVTNATSRRIARGKSLQHRDGPHCAVGVIHYPNDEDGWLLYVKASFTGDEPDYITNYKRRFPAFPHESTGDQFFSEEQFESYRALGFHAAENFLSPEQNFAWSPSCLPRGCTAKSAEQVRSALLGAIP